MNQVYLTSNPVQLVTVWVTVDNLINLLKDYHTFLKCEQ